MLAPDVWFLAAGAALVAAARVALPRPTRRALLRFALVSLLVASFFYGAAGPARGTVAIGFLRFDGQDFLVGLEAGARLAALLTLFALGARWLPATALLPYTTRGGPAAYVASALLRIVPTIRADAQRLRDAQAARGHRFRGGWRGARSWLPFIVPLFVSVLRRAREQSIAVHLAGVLPQPGAARSGARAHRWTLVAALAALAIAGRLALVAWPGVSLSFFVIFVAGVAFGPLAGLLVGLVERVATDLLLTGFHPVFLAMAPVEGFLGFASGVVGRVVNFGQRGREPLAYAAALATFAGAAMTIAFSLAADTVSWLLWYSFLPQAAPQVLGASWAVLVAAGLVFNLPGLMFNATIFGVAAYPTLRALRASGVLPAPVQRRVAPS